MTTNNLLTSLETNLQQSYMINDFIFKIESKIGIINDVEYYQVLIENDHQEKLGLLRIGSEEGGLKRELELRELLGKHKMVSPLLTYQKSPDFLLENQEQKSSSNVQSSPNLEINEQSDLLDQHNNSSDSLVELTTLKNTTPENSNSLSLEAESNFTDQQKQEFIDTKEIELLPTEEREYLEEESYEIEQKTNEEKLLILTELLKEEETLFSWTNKNSDLKESLLLVSQLTQFFRLIVKQKWCIISLLPQFIKQSQNGNPIIFFDLTTAYPLNAKLNVGLVGDYYSPEIGIGEEINELMSTYVVGSFLYQILHGKLPPSHDNYLIDLEENLDLEIKKIPLIHQIINIALSPIPENRFSLSQLLNLLISTRKYYESENIRWQVASQSTVGLSLGRLQNEDNYGIKQSSGYDEPSFLLAVIADGMGGMAQGEIASKTAVETILHSPKPDDLTVPQKCHEWLVSLVSEANKAVCEKVHNGGTTLSMVMTSARHLYIAQVGDSRIFLLRKGRICQLSEDHSLVAMLLATEQISYQESLNHPDKNMLTKSLGSNPILPHNYVQTLTRFGGESWLNLENEDIVLICSDGVWDLVSTPQLAEIFTTTDNLSLAVTTTIQEVLAKGAKDNATLIALKCHIESNFF